MAGDDYKDADEAFTRKRPLLVSFSGIDGSGKTTQIEALSDWLRDAGLCVRLLRFWDDIAVAGRLRETLSHKLFKSEKGVGSPDNPVERRDKNVRNWYMTVARSFIYFMDAAHLTFIVATASRKNADVVIFDRYLHDQVVNLGLQNTAARVYANWLLKMVPRPDVAFLLDADPKQARARKPEYPVEFLENIRASYLAIAQSSGMITISPLAVPDVTRSMLRAMPPVSRLRTFDPPQAAPSHQSHQ